MVKCHSYPDQVSNPVPRKEKDRFALIATRTGGTSVSSNLLSITGTYSRGDLLGNAIAGEMFSNQGSCLKEAPSRSGCRNYFLYSQNGWIDLRPVPEIPYCVAYTPEVSLSRKINRQHNSIMEHHSSRGNL